jgi:hypothetical protein
MRLVILLIVAMLAGTIECAASCATVNRESSCHHDQKSPIACAHELVIDRVDAHGRSAGLLPDGRGSVTLYVCANPLFEPVLQSRDGHGAVIPSLRI